MVGPYTPCAQFIRLARAASLRALFLNVSFVGAEQLASNLGAEGEGVIVAQVVPHYDANLPIVRDYRAALAASDKQLAPTFTSLEGYVSGRILLTALANASGADEREAVVRSLESLGEFDLGLGQSLKLSGGEHQASHRVWASVIHAGKVVPLEWNQLKTTGL